MLHQRLYSCAISALLLGMPIGATYAQDRTHLAQAQERGEKAEPEDQQPRKRERRERQDQGAPERQKGEQQQAPGRAPQKGVEQDRQKGERTQADPEQKQREDRQRADQDRQKGDRTKADQEQRQREDRQRADQERQKGDRAKADQEQRQREDRQRADQDRQKGDRAKADQEQKQREDRQRADQERQKGDRPQADQEQRKRDDRQRADQDRQKGDRAKADQEQRQRDDRQRADQERQKGERTQADQEQRQREDRQRADQDRQKGDRTRADQARDGRPQAVEPSGGRLDDIKKQRRERVEAGGQRTIIEEPDRRVIVKEQGRTIIRHDETQRFSKLSRDVRTDRGRDGITVNIFTRPDGQEVVSELDDDGRVLRRYRRDRSGRQMVLFDNRQFYRQRDRRDRIVFIDLPTPRITIPREKYIVEYSAASDEDIYEALTAPPVERIERGYALEEVRRSQPLRERMRRVDLDDINFEFGAWDITSDQLPKLERLARVINSILRRRPEEVFLIEGHTDAVGSDDDNLTLSDRRAEAVAVILSDQFEVPAENLTTQGYGEQFLKVDTRDAERLNRRVAARRITPLLARDEGRERGER